MQGCPTFKDTTRDFKTLSFHSYFMLNTLEPLRVYIYLVSYRGLEGTVHEKT